MGFWGVSITKKNPLILRAFEKICVKNRFKKLYGKISQMLAEHSNYKYLERLVILSRLMKYFTNIQKITASMQPAEIIMVCLQYYKNIHLINIEPVGKWASNRIISLHYYLLNTNIIHS